MNTFLKKKIYQYPGICQAVSLGNTILEQSELPCRLYTIPSQVFQFEIISQYHIYTLI